MDHDTIKDLIPAYALGATDAQESSAVESHIAGCPDCQALLASYRTLSEALAYAVPQMSAPAGISERMRLRLAPPQPGIRTGSRWSWLRRGWLAPALAVSIFLLVLTNALWVARTGVLQGSGSQRAAAFATLTAGHAVPLQPGASVPEAQGVVYKSNDGQTALLCVYGLPALEKGKTYQLWLIRNGQRESGGLFDVTGDGFGLLVVGHERPLSDYSGVGVTVEPAGGSPKPTSPRLIGGNL